MPYVIIDDFRLGMDRRREQVVGPPGSVWTLTNGHITRGGDIEGRKPFRSVYALPVGTYGLTAAENALYVFGSSASIAGIPAEVTYQRLQHPDGRPIDRVLHTEIFDGKIYAVARYSDGSVHHFYNGVRVEDWDDGIVRLDMVNLDGIAEHLRELLDGQQEITATRAGAVVTLTGAAGTAFTATGTTENVDGGTDDQALTIATTQVAIAGIAEVLAQGSFEITGGTSNPGTNKVTSITVNSVELLAAPVDWLISHAATAQQIAAAINANTTSPNYTAEAAAAVVTITAVAGSGATPNGFVVAVTPAGDVTNGTPVNMAGGVTAVAGQSQVTTVTVGGTFDVGDKFNVQIGTVNYGYVGKPTPKGTFVKTFGTKIYAAGGSMVQFPAVNSPTVWDRDTIDPPGAGFINMASHHAGSTDLTSLGDFQGNLAVFARDVIQTWYVDVDPDQNQKLQVILNTGTRSPRSVVSLGNTDTFYLHDTGIRSLRARDASNAPFASDVGNSIDSYVREVMLGLSDDQIERAIGLIEPESSRYWMIAGTHVFVLSHFPESKITAWSAYDVSGEMPGGVSDVAMANRIVYARSGDTIYAYGGTTGQLEAVADEVPITVQLPFLSAQKDGHMKLLGGFDMVGTGSWTAEILVDPRDTNRKLAVGPAITSAITPDLPSIPLPGECTYAAPRLTSTAGGTPKLMKVLVHYDLGQQG